MEWISHSDGLVTTVEKRSAWYLKVVGGLRKDRFGGNSGTLRQCDRGGRVREVKM